MRRKGETEWGESVGPHERESFSSKRKSDCFDFLKRKAKADDRQTTENLESHLDLEIQNESGGSLDQLAESPDHSLAEGILKGRPYGT